MPRKRRQLTGIQRLTFPRFSRAVASICLAKHQMRKSKLCSSSPEGNRFVEHDLKEKNEVSESSEELDYDGVVQADFVFFDPKPDDFHGVKILLQTYLDDKQWDLSGFVKMILEQTTVGTVVKIEDDEDDRLFSIITALNLGRYKDYKCIKELKEFLLKACKQKDVTESLRCLLEEQARSAGFLVSQRVVNLPPHLLTPLYDALFDEILWAIEDEPTKELRKSCFKNYLIASKIYKNAGQKKWQNSHSDEAIIYIKPEDEIFHKLRNYQSMGLIMAVEAERIPSF